MNDLPEIIIKTKYECPYCSNESLTENSAIFCRGQCHKAEEATKMLESGATLFDINNKWKLWTNLPEYLKDTTKDNCFTISYLQCCDYPAYRIVRILGNMKVRVWGIGSWTSGYGVDCNITDHNLKNPRPKEELFIWKENGPWACKF